MRRLSVALAAFLVLCPLLAGGDAAAGAAPEPPPQWTVVSDGIQLDVPASWPVFGATHLPCPRPGSTVWIDQPSGLPASSCLPFSSDLRTTTVVVGALGATRPVAGRASTVNGLAVDVAVSTAPTPVVTSAFPAQHAELTIASLGATTKAERADALRLGEQLLHSVRAATSVDTGLPLSGGPPLALTVTSVRPGLAPYDPALGHHGIPIEVVTYHLAKVPTESFVCQTTVRRHGRLVGYTGSGHAPPGPHSPPAPAGYSPQNPSESVQLSGPTFQGVPSDATVTCRPEGTSNAL